MEWKRTIELLAPTFCRGAYQDTPEIRAPSIRGMVRWWFRALNAPPEHGGGDRRKSWGQVWLEENDLFGGVASGGTASRLVFRVIEVNAKPDEFDTLPHKPTPGQRSPLAGFAPGGTFTLQITSRLRPIPEAITQKLAKALDAWILLGSLGFRSNRASGSLWPTWDDAPRSPQDLRAKLTDIGCPWPVYLAGTEVGTTLQELRAAATDTVEEPRWVFGSAKRDRFASPLKFKIVRLEGSTRLLITAPDERTIETARQSLHGHRSKPETWARI